MKGAKGGWRVVCSVQSSNQELANNAEHDIPSSCSVSGSSRAMRITQGIVFSRVAPVSRCKRIPRDPVERENESTTSRLRNVQEKGCCCCWRCFSVDRYTTFNLEREGGKEISFLKQTFNWSFLVVASPRIVCRSHRIAFDGQRRTAIVHWRIRRTFCWFQFSILF